MKYDKIYLMLSIFVFVPEASAKPNQDCSLEKDPGTCEEHSLRWYYNSREQKCKKLYYRGCEGNTNNFVTKQDCITNCATKVTKLSGVCNLPFEVGPCKARKQRWYYNSQEQRCDVFYYGGCQGNDNNFVTAQECNDTCAEPSSDMCPTFRCGKLCRYGFKTNRLGCLKCKCKKRRPAH